MDAPVDIAPEIFRAYDIRGIAGRNLTAEAVSWIGRAFAAESLDRGFAQVAVGGDGRSSTGSLREALVSGLAAGGCDVIDVGVVPTPLLYYATYALETQTGIMITGSHNPAEYNGLKMVIGGTVLSGGAISNLRSRIERGDCPMRPRGAVRSADVIESYMDRVEADVDLARPLKIVMDSGNGVAGLVAPSLFERLGCEVVSLYADVDGSFPNHHPDPADPANLDDLIAAVHAHGADMGVAFDGDADRLGVVTNSGRIIWPDRLMMLFARDIAVRNPGTDIVYDVKCSRHLGKVVAEAGGNPIMSRTGHSHIKARIRETGALFGGEFSGHICFGERWFGFDDAIYAGARLLEIAAARDCPLDDLFADFPVPCTTPEIKVPTSESAKFRIIEELSESADFGPGTVTRIDGLRVDYEDGFGLVRASNTSPALTLRFEADDADALARIRSTFGVQLSAVDPALTF
ncbi:MAG: phosphomannomutase/phosphoglucomutase [Gammaproteobacteria bacterium]|nr:phosphomannomutase/phosphoglucomutase [Gammaproteobacteria bacterium]